MNKERGAQKCANLKCNFKIAQIGERNVPLVLEAGIILFYDNWHQLRRQLMTIIFFETKIRHIVPTKIRKNQGIYFKDNYCQFDCQ